MHGEPDREPTLGGPPSAKWVVMDYDHNPVAVRDSPDEAITALAAVLRRRLKEGGWTPPGLMFYVVQAAEP